MAYLMGTNPGTSSGMIVVQKANCRWRSLWVQIQVQAAAALLLSCLYLELSHHLSLSFSLTPYFYPCSVIPVQWDISMGIYSGTNLGTGTNADTKLSECSLVSGTSSPSPLHSNSRQSVHASPTDSLIVD